MAPAGHLHPEVVSLSRRRAIVACVCAAGAALAASSAQALPRAELERTHLDLHDTAKKLQPSAPALERAAAPPAVSPQLAAIAACESGGDPAAVGGGGLYRGKYQFSYETWQSVGGTGDPAAAPEAEQDARAADLLARDGAGHWPVCGG